MMLNGVIYTHRQREGHNMNDLLSNMMETLVDLVGRDLVNTAQQARIDRLSRIIGRALNVAPQDVLDEAQAIVADEND